MDKNRLRLRLKAARKNAHMTQKEASDLSLVTEFTIRQWECGAFIPTLKNLENLAKAYGTTVYSLIEGVFD